MNEFLITDILFSVFFLMGIFYMIKIQFKNRKNHLLPKKRDKKDWKMAILIPARDESKVIEELLKSIKNQSIKIPMNDVHVVIETKEDKTKEISDKYGASVFIRKELELQRKGFALNEVVKHILEKKKKYDFYIIVDADNILKEDFLEQIVKSYEEGYDIVASYRKSKNGNKNVIAACSTLIFSLINQFVNRLQAKSNGNALTCGSGLLIDGNLIDKWNCYPFHTLTEDYEITLYAISNEIPSTCNMDAELFDEQPESYKQTVKQRVRWIKGYLSCRKHYAKTLRKQAKVPSLNQGAKYSEGKGIMPYVLMVLAIILSIGSYLVIAIISLINKTSLWKICLLRIAIILLLVYFIIAILTAILLFLEKDKINLSLSMKIKAIFFHPLFLVTYIPCLIKAIFKKEVKWDKIEHNSDLIK